MDATYHSTVRFFCPQVTLFVTTFYVVIQIGRSAPVGTLAPVLQAKNLSPKERMVAGHVGQERKFSRGLTLCAAIVGIKP